MKNLNVEQRLELYKQAKENLSGGKIHEFICTALQYHVQQMFNERMMLKETEEYFPELARFIPIEQNGRAVRIEVLDRCIAECHHKLSVVVFAKAG